MAATLLTGASSGISTTALVSWSRADSATAWLWFPDEVVSTPPARTSGSSAATWLYAPRSLKAPIRWRFSALRWSWAPVRSSSVRERSTGVRWATPARRPAAARTSSMVTGESGTAGG